MIAPVKKLVSKLPRPRTDDRELRRWIDAITDTVELREGDRGDLMEKAVTWRDLLEGGFGKVRTSARGTPLEPTTTNEEFDAPYMAVPPAMTGVEAAGAIQNVIVSWDDPFSKYRNHSYVEVWRSDSDDLGTALLVGAVAGSMYADKVGPGQSYYYWVRAVSTANVPGAYNAVGGTFGSTGMDVAYTMSVLTDVYGGTSDAPFFQIDAPTVIGGTTVPAGTYIKAAFIHEAQITSAQIQSLAADKIDAVELSAISANLGTITAGSLNINGKFIVDAFGNTTIRSAATGARLVIQNNVIKVYDASGTLRVRLGDLTA